MRSAPLMMAAASLGLGTMFTTAYAQPSFSFTETDTAQEGDVVLLIGSDLELSGEMAAIDAATAGRLSQAITQTGFGGSFGEALKLHAMAPYDDIVLVGTGDGELTPRQLQDLGGHAASHSDDDAMLLANDLNTDVEAAGAYIASGFALRSYSFDKYKSGSSESEQQVTLIVEEAADSTALYRDDLAHVVTGVTFARDIGTEPGNAIYPDILANRTRALFSGVPNVQIQILDARAIRREGMGALMGVGQGSIHDPRMVVINYRGAGTNDAPIALVGKGITFDTGGISLKTSDTMWMMKADLSGAVAVAGAIYAAAQREEPINIVGLMPLAENMPGQDAIRPGDVLTTMGGKTIEILNTDAEGRLLLSDAVQYAQEKFDPRLLLNIATLTGSAGRATGDEYAVVITRDLDFSLEMVEVGKISGEDVWPLPLHPNHFDQIQSPIADIKNIGGIPGASTGAAVVGTFVDEDLPWIHLDIAGVDWLDSPTPTTPAGHAGWGVRFMDQFIRQEADK